MLTGVTPPRAIPFLKWPGGKRGILDKITPYLPASYGTYYEPFIGGGALFFALAPRLAILSDVNGDLITTYRIVRDRPCDLIDRLALHAQDHSLDYYHMQRRAQPSDPLDIAARLIYLNHTCFNGLYRVNRAGVFNVPMGRYVHPRICDPASILAASRALQSAIICRRDFLAALNEAQPGDLVYCDPPYVPASDSANFTAYTRDGFTLADQERLRNTAQVARDRGVRVILSNSDTPATRELYAGWYCQQITAPRSISCKATDRSAAGELLIFSYDNAAKEDKAS